MALRRTCYPCNTVITPRGNFMNDDYFKSARKALDDLMVQMNQANNHQQILRPSNKVDYLLAELGAWQQSGQNLGAALNSCRHDDLFPAVFRFEPDSMKMLIDVKGYQPPNLKLNIKGEVVEVLTTQEEASTNNTSTQVGQNCIGYATRHIKIRYTLPQKLVTECVQCSLSQDGVLFISAPWLRC